MAKKVTIRDVAKCAGVSLGTASRVINGSENVAQELRRNVERAIAEIGFQPNAAAQAMKRGTSRTVGLLVSDITTHRLAYLVRAAQIELERSGYGVFIACHENDRDREAEALRFLSARRVEGLIHSNCNDRATAMNPHPPGLSVPTVIFDRDGPPHADAVRVSHYAAVRHAAEYLLGLGHRRIGLITGPEFMYPARTRIEGLRDAFAAAGVECNPGDVISESFSEAFADTSRMIGCGDRPTAIILGGGSMLPGAIRAIRAHGLEIPRDISLIAAGDSDLAQLITPAMTVMRWSYSEVGQACATTLLSRMRAPEGKQRSVMIEPELVVRQSCAPAP